jgi:hypothetical protein
MSSTRRATIPTSEIAVSIFRPHLRLKRTRTHRWSRCNDPLKLSTSRASTQYLETNIRVYIIAVDYPCCVRFACAHTTFRLSLTHACYWAQSLSYVRVLLNVINITLLFILFYFILFYLFYITCLCAYQREFGLGWMHERPRASMYGFLLRKLDLQIIRVWKNSPKSGSTAATAKWSSVITTRLRARG